MGYETEENGQSVFSVRNPYRTPFRNVTFAQLVSDEASGYDGCTWSQHAQVIWYVLGFDLATGLDVSGATPNHVVGRRLMSMLADIYDAVIVFQSTTTTSCDGKIKELQDGLVQWCREAGTQRSGEVGLEPERLLTLTARYEIAAYVLETGQLPAKKRPKFRPSEYLTRLFLSAHDREEWGRISTAEFKTVLTARRHGMHHLVAVHRQPEVGDGIVPLPIVQ